MFAFRHKSAIAVFEFGNSKSVGNGLEAILTATFRLLNTGNHILQDQALVSVGHLVYHLVQRLQGVLGEANIAKLLEQVVLRLSKARFSSCIENLYVYSKTDKQIWLSDNCLLKVDCGIVKLRINDAVHESRHSLLSIVLHIWNDQWNTWMATTFQS